MSMPVCSIPEIVARSSATRVFIHATTSVGELPGVNVNDDESSMAMLLARSHDIVIVPSPVETECLDYFRGLGIAVNPQRILTVAGSHDTPLPERLITDTSALEQIKNLVDDEPVLVDSFTICEREIALTAKLAHRLGRQVSYVGADLDITQTVNRKDTARQLALDIGVPVAPGELVRGDLRAGKTACNCNALAAAIRLQMGTTGRVIVKGVVGASGSATFIITKTSSIDEFVQKIALRRDNSDYLVEPLFERVAAPNITVWIAPDDGEVTLVNATDQRLSENLVYAGNTFPYTAKCHSDMVNGTEAIAKALYQKGFSGWAGFDFAEYQDPLTGKYRFFLSEINARFNGGLYGKALFDLIQIQQQQRHCPVPSAYITDNIMTSPVGFVQLLDLCGDLLFDKETGYGVVPFNPGRLQDGKVSLSCIAPTLEKARQLASAIVARIHG